MDEVIFDTIEDGLSIQMLHIGSYDDGPNISNDFIAHNNLEKTTLVHREIYLSDARKVGAAKLKTVLRYSVRPMV